MTEKHTILVSGVSGYLASWIVKQLLEQGHDVHGTVRNLEQKQKYAHLEDIAAKSDGNLRLFEADLTSEGSFSEAIKGCNSVIHSASPFIIGKINDPRAELIVPAVEGTRNILHEASKTPGIKRVVQTSSAVAIYGDAKDADDIPGRIFTEEHWNETSSEDHQPYSYSKTLAEREAWKMAESQDQWDLVVINPSFIMGPYLGDNLNSASNDFIKRYGKGDLKLGAPELYWGVVDVRDVAAAHVKAALGEGKSGRYILSAQVESALSIGEMLAEEFGSAYAFPKRFIPKPLIILMGPANGMPRKMLRRNIGYAFGLDNRRSIEQLGINYRNVKDTVAEHFQQMIEANVFSR